MLSPEQQAVGHIEEMLSQNVAVEVKLPQQTAVGILSFINNTNPDYSGGTVDSYFTSYWSSIDALSVPLVDEIAEVYRIDGDRDDAVTLGILPSHIEALDKVAKLSGVPDVVPIVEQLKNEYDNALEVSFPDRDQYFSQSRIIWFALESDCGEAIQEMYIEYSHLFDDINPNEKENNLLLILGKMLSRVVRADNNHENAVLCSLRQKEMEDVAREMLEQLRLNKKPDFAKSFKKINISFEESGGKRTKAYREYLEERPNNA